MPDPLFIQAPAKVNLALAVGPPRADADGHHPICSWMAPVTLFDDLTLTPLPEGYFSRYAILWAADARRKTDIDWSVTKDLAVRAHLLLEETVDRKLPVQLKLDKRIPVGAGLGGGSSDAAAMLMGCNRLFNLGLSPGELTELASLLGSDVPFFLHRGAAVIEGFGERIAPAAGPEELHLALFTPEFSCETRAVYGAFDKIASGGRAAVGSGFAAAAARVRGMAAAPRIDPTTLFNDLRDPAFEHRPDLRNAAAAFVDLAERPVLLTGSGSTLFAVCDNALHAEFLADAARQRLGPAAWAVGLHQAAPSRGGMAA